MSELEKKQLCVAPKFLNLNLTIQDSSDLSINSLIS